VSGPATILEPPEAGSRIAIVDVEAKDADAAVALAWAAYGTDKKWPDADIAAKSKMFLESMAAERKLLTAPADAAESAKLAAHYKNAALGAIRVSRAGGATIFDFGEWKSEVGSRRNPDGSISFVTTAPGISRMEFVVGRGAKRTLIIRDAQHEYVFDEK